MKLLPTLIVTVLSINLCACSTVGNVVPKTGPNMEQVYDNMGKTQQQKPLILQETVADTEHVSMAASSPSSMQKFSREESLGNHSPDSIPAYRTTSAFKKIPNPELKLYVYPHFAGSEEVPVPGYITVFNAYDRDHYALNS